MNNYFQAILQLRNVDEGIIEFVESEVKANAFKGVFVSKVKKVRGGVDVYISKNKFAMSLGRKLEKKYGGFLDISEKLFTKDRQSSKDLYRVNVLFKPLDIRVGEVILLGKKPIIVTSIFKKLVGRNLQTGKPEHVDFKKENFSKLEIHNSSVTRKFPSYEILHPQTYESIELILINGSLSVGQKIKVAVANDKAYFIK